MYAERLCNPQQIFAARVLQTPHEPCNSGHGRFEYLPGTVFSPSPPPLHNIKNRSIEIPLRLYIYINYFRQADFLLCA